MKWPWFMKVSWKRFSETVCAFARFARFSTLSAGWRLNFQFSGLKMDFAELQQNGSKALLSKD